MFLFAVFDMSHLYFTFKQDICSNECKKYTVNPVNKLWTYTYAQMENLMGLYSGEGLYTDELNSGRKTLQFPIC